MVNSSGRTGAHLTPPPYDISPVDAGLDPLPREASCLESDVVASPQEPAEMPHRGALPFRTDLEGAFGRSFRGVRVSLGDTSGPGMFNADAFTMKERIAFRSRTPGLEVIAHELAHVVQQSQGDEGLGLSAPVPDLEREADGAAAAVLAGQKPVVRLGASSTQALQWEAGEHALLGDSGFMVGVLASFAKRTLGFTLSTSDNAPVPCETEQIRVAALEGQGEALEVFLEICAARGVVVSRSQAEQLDALLGLGRQTKTWTTMKKLVTYSYGQATAMAGDFAESARDLANLAPGEIQRICELMEKERLFGKDGLSTSPAQEKVDAERLGDARTRIAPDSFPNNNLEYSILPTTPFLALAAKNYSHFGAGNLRQYGVNHTRALLLAVGASTGNGTEALKIALQVNAFGDHFLADAFCSGHIRTPRRAIVDHPRVREIFWTATDTQCALIGKILHDLDNQLGLWVQCVNRPDIKPWRCYGDKMLGASPETVRVASLAIATSVAEVLDVAATGEIPSNLAALDYFPVLAEGTQGMADLVLQNPKVVEEIRQAAAVADTDNENPVEVSALEFNAFLPCLEEVYDREGTGMAEAALPRAGEIVYPMRSDIIAGLRTGAQGSGRDKIAIPSICWSGRTLEFTVERLESSQPLNLYVLWFNDEFGNYLREDGTSNVGTSCEYESVGSAMVTVASGQENVGIDVGPADNPGHTFGVIYRDPNCTFPLRKSPLQP